MKNLLPCIVYVRGGKAPPAGLAATTACRLKVKRKAVRALVLCWVLLVGSDLYGVERAVVDIAAVMSAGSYCALNTLVCIVIRHLKIPPYIFLARCYFAQIGD